MPFRRASAPVLTGAKLPKPGFSGEKLEIPGEKPGKSRILAEYNSPLYIITEEWLKFNKNCGYILLLLCVIF